MKLIAGGTSIQSDMAGKACVCQTFLRTLKYLLITFYVLITEASGINPKN